MATFLPALHRSPARSVEDSQMTVLSHLSALRRTLIVSILAWSAATALAFLVWGRVLQLLIHQGGVGAVYYTTPAGAFTLALKISLYLGFVIASPVIIQQIWWFVSPGLHRHERRLIVPLIGATFFFFAVGIAFAMLMLPIFLRILSGFAPSNLHFLPFVDDYISFVLVLILGFGIVFELPVVLYALGRIGIISSRWLYTHRLYWIVGLGILSALGTPGADPITPFFMFIPLYIFFEGTALLLKLTGR
ncbi:MAG TPA: twin-arginine translocase subunit TatC [Candidatus Dormibacteraeota bacterium]|nr:twin-arginine translocase subunit TatC [Candidatus Dormibacteraeota bacterium]